MLPPWRTWLRLSRDICKQNDWGQHFCQKPKPGLPPCDSLPSLPLNSRGQDISFHLSLKVLLIRNYKKATEELKSCKRWTINIKSLEKAVRILTEGLSLSVENTHLAIFNALLVLSSEYIPCGVLNCRGLGLKLFWVVLGETLRTTWPGEGRRVLGGSENCGVLWSLYSMHDLK